MFSLKKLVTGPMQVNTYILGETESREAIVVDPGGNRPGIQQVLEQQGWTLKKIVLTHGHGDHIGAVIELKEQTGVPVAVHRDDAEMLADSQKNFTSMMGGGIQFKADELLDDGEALKLGTDQIKVIHTPGHTPGGICLLAGELLISGDTLFLQSIGRTDLEGGSHRQLIESIKTKLMNLSDTVKVYPGHGPDTTIGFEKKSNPYL
jgi:hydroxyacylglutathione hydrolase